MLLDFERFLVATETVSISLRPIAIKGLLAAVANLPQQPCWFYILEIRLQSFLELKT